MEGAEHLPQRPAVILAKHQSAWETMAFQLIFPPQVMCSSASFCGFPSSLGARSDEPDRDRSQEGLAALRAMATKGAQRLSQGFWVVVFRKARASRRGAARLPARRRWLAAAANAPVVPVAHNAGLLWPR